MIIGGKAVNPGQLDTPITLQKRTMATDAGGFEKPIWSTIAAVMAKWTGVHGSEAWTIMQVRMERAATAIRAATVLIRWRSDIDESCALLKDGERYEIVSIDDIQARHEYLEIKVQFVHGG
jgi:SPP1 family predicted phage head-tail adaptor